MQSSALAVWLPRISSSLLVGVAVDWYQTEDPARSHKRQQHLPYPLEGGLEHHLLASAALPNLWPVSVGCNP